MHHVNLYRMNIVLIGYGRMGKAIERLATERGHQIVGKIDMDTSLDERKEVFKKGDVAIEFSHPSAAFENIIQALDAGIPTVSGTTGWTDRLKMVGEKVVDTKGKFLYASNFSIGVNIMFAINEQLAKLMNDFDDYDVAVEEIHHVHKKDAPSGTALTLTNGILEHVARKTGWTLDKSEGKEIEINAMREGEVFGTHKIKYTSPIDTIELYHDAYTRDGFATGAITAAAWMCKRESPGVYTMKDMMGI